MENANYTKLTSMHFYAWKSGLKTGMNYLLTKASVDAIKFTLDNSKKKEMLVNEAVETEVVVQAQVISKAIGADKAVFKVTPKTELDIQLMTPQETKEMIAKTKESQVDDDCLMCGS